ncbi:ubiquitin-conjugating enzyme E2 H [Leucoagaricus gongylophorus]
MPLFRDNPIRAGAIVAMTLFAGHYATKLMSSVYALHLTQTSVALLAIASLIVLVTVHNRRGAEFLSQTEQEMILVGGIALFWIAALVAWRGFRGESSISSSLANPTTMVANSKAGSKFSNDWPCGPNDVYCMVEEYNYW